MVIQRPIVQLLKASTPNFIARQRLVQTDQRTVLLTFDDGPCPEVTPRILELLHRWHAKAVFFVLGKRVAKAPSVLSDIIAAGHEVGNHTFSHRASGGFRDTLADILKCQELLIEHTGHVPKYFRPPKGKLSAGNVFAARICGLRTIRWSFDTGEYSYLNKATTEGLAANLVDNLMDRSIVLSHDDTIKTEKFLALALPQIVDRGFDLSNGLSCLS